MSEPAGANGCSWGRVYENTTLSVIGVLRVYLPWLKSAARLAYFTERAIVSLRVYLSWLKSATVAAARLAYFTKHAVDSLYG